MPSPWNLHEGTSASTSGADLGNDATSTPRTAPAADSPADDPKPRRRYKPRTCRICLEVVPPTFEDAGDGPAAFFRRSPRVRYICEDPDDRLISPCRCKGSQKYVHEGCLQAWRIAQPMADRNYWKCPTCSFEYKFERLKWGRWISSRITRVCLTILTFVLTVFILGFVADPIINMWLDPVGTVADTVGGHLDDFNAYDEFGADEPEGWFDHFIKGFFSLGLLGFLKTMWAMSPFYWFNFRAGGGRNRRGGGRDRLEDINLAYVIIGAFTFMGVSKIPTFCNAAPRRLLVLMFLAGCVESDQLPEWSFPGQAR